MKALTYSSPVGHVRAVPGRVAKFDNTYSSDLANLARQDLAGLLDGFTRILAGCGAVGDDLAAGEHADAGEQRGFLTPQPFDRRHRPARRLPAHRARADRARLRV